MRIDFSGRIRQALINLKEYVLFVTCKKIALVVETNLIAAFEIYWKI